MVVDFLNNRGSVSTFSFYSTFLKKNIKTSERMKIIINCFIACMLNVCVLAQQTALNVDDTTRQIKIEKGQVYLSLPVSESAKLVRAKILYEGKLLDQFTIKLAPEKPDYWVFFDAAPYQGKILTLEISKFDPPPFGGMAQPAVNTQTDT